MSQNLDYDILVSLATIAKSKEEREKLWNEASQYIKELNEEEYQNLLKTCTHEEKILTQKLKSRV
jgi:hypothetical protein